MESRQGTRPCPRTLDAPITILGVEPGEFVLTGAAAAVVMFLVDPVPAVALGVGTAFLLHRLKAGKPPGHLFLLLYRCALIRLLPASLRVPHLLPPPPPWRRARIRLSPVSSDVPDRVVRFYWPSDSPG